MIKFFRKKRKDLMEKNLPAGQASKTGKLALPEGRYFKYAIGEIVLVVIGILIALQINNWNIQKVKEKESYKQLLEVQNEIFNNLLEFDIRGNYYNEKLRDIRSVFSDTLVFEDYKTRESLYSIMSTHWNVEIQNEAFNKLIQNADNLPDTYKPLILQLKKHYNLSTFESDFQVLLDENAKFSDFTEDSNEAFYRDEKDDYIRFLMTDKVYKNKLAGFSFTLDDITPELGKKKFEAIHIYSEMVALGFPDKNMRQLEKIFVAIHPETVAPFIGRYSNGISTLSIRYNKKDNTLLGTRSFMTGKKNTALKIMIKNKATLHLDDGSYLEFNDSKSAFFTLQERLKPHYKRILEEKATK